MTAGYKVWNGVGIIDKLILVSNYEGTNRITNLGCLNTEELKRLNDCHDIGFWRLKPKKSLGKK